MSMMYHGNPIHWCLLVSVAYVLPKYEQCVSLQNKEEIIIKKLGRKLTRLINPQMPVKQAIRHA